MNVLNAPSLHLEGKVLNGSKTSHSWTVGEKIVRPKDASGGTFSVGYTVTASDGTEAFLKATDIGLLRIETKISRLEQMSEAFNLQKFERDMLDLCTVSGMDRIVRALDYGEFEVVHQGVREYVFFIIFERATGDIRARSRDYRKTGTSWIPRVVHNLAVATTQLHRKEITHNDIKPSNLLVFDAALQKLSDLGRATCARINGPWDGLSEAGDRTYSPPEAWGYHYSPPMEGLRLSHTYRRRFDIYMLGSLVFFLLTEQSLNTVMASFLRPEYGPSNWAGTFEDILPYLKDVHGCAMQIMDEEVEHSYGNDGFEGLEEIRTIVRYLTEADPLLRGDPRNHAAGLRTYDLQRLISRSALLSKKLAMLDKHELGR